MKKALSEKYRELPRCACFNLRKASRAVTQHYDRILQPAGLRATQFAVLAVLKTSSGITITKLAEILVMDRTTLTRNLGLLERDGLISIHAGEDRRQKIAMITPPGEIALENALPYWEKAQNWIVTQMGSDPFQAFLQTMTALTGAISGE